MPRTYNLGVTLTPMTNRRRIRPRATEASLGRNQSQGDG